MKVSTNTGVLSRCFGLKKSLEIIKESGFTAFDLSLYGSNGVPLAPFNNEDYLDVAKEMRIFADKLGLPCNQSHAVFGSHLGAGKTDSVIFKGTVRCMEIAAIMGAPSIVVHPMQYLPYMSNVEFLKKENLEFYNDLLPYAEKLGIVMLTENMWQRNKNNNQIIGSVCSEAKKFREYVDMLNSPYLKACLDIGHTFLTGESVANMITTLGKVRLFGLHIHDVDGIRDSHTLPYTLNVDFNEMLDSLAKISYEGDITFEADHFISVFPDELKASALKLMADVGHYFKDEFEKRSKQ